MKFKDNIRNMIRFREKVRNGDKDRVGNRDGLKEEEILEEEIQFFGMNSVKNQIQKLSWKREEERWCRKAETIFNAM